MRFKYKAKKSDGKITEDFAVANDKFDLAHILKQQNLTLLTAKPAEKKSGADWFAKINEAVVRVSFKDKIFFASNLAEMINAGLPLSRALNVLHRQSTNKKLKRVIQTIVDKIDKGGSFADALAEHPKIFSPVFIAMVSAGEKSGKLPQSLKTVSDQLHKSYALRKKVRGALVYPSIIVLAMVLIGVIMMIYIVPTLAATFEDVGAELPFTTKIVLFISDMILNNYIIMGLLLLGLIAGLMKYRKTAIGKRQIAFMFLHFPLIKNITKEINSAVTARTMSSLISSGVDIVEALKITEQVVQNVYYKEVLQKAQIELPKGGALSKIFRDHENIYPPFVNEMASVGEETGKLSGMLEKLAKFYEDEVDAAMKDISTVIEPLIMILVGAAVGFFALSMIQPIYSIGNSI